MHRNWHMQILKVRQVVPISVDIAVYIIKNACTYLLNIFQKQVSVFLWNAVEEAGCQFDNVCGVPYTALPLATVSIQIRQRERQAFHVHVFSQSPQRRSVTYASGIRSFVGKLSKFLSKSCKCILLQFYLMNTAIILYLESIVAICLFWKMISSM